jgi:opacity protein-like surface antigen
MKTLVRCVAATAFLATLCMGDYIDGTLAVDNYNNQSQNGSFVPEYKPNNDTATKGSDEPVTSAPVSAYTGSGFLEGPFVGIELGYILSADADGRDTSGLAYGLRFGAQNLEWRTMAVLQKYSTDDGINDYLKGELNLDYFFLGADNLVVENYAIRPYVGLNLGAISMDTQSKTENSITYGGQVGATMNLTTQIDLDVGYKYNLSTSDSINSLSGISAGLHYKY